ncbi:uncharacterized protein LOC117224088 isoform X1 [Megalopta genalis]|uniref:uncharacterized protein LOC117224088 isoform X1 n=2 Tax=Megalopta genalis TaxID=115081 RepID=UPI003FD59DDC
MLCLKKRRTYSFTQGVCAELPRRASKDNHRYEGSLDMAITTLPRKNRNREERPSRMVLTVTEDTPADMLAGSMELLVQLPREHHQQTQRVTVPRSTPMMDLLVQIATAHKLTASSYTLQAIGERGRVLPHQPNTPIGALDALQVKLLPKQGTFVPRKAKQANQPFETTFRLQVHLPRNQLYVSRVSPKMNLGEILDEVCREKNLDRSKYELRHPANLETLDLSLSLQDYHLQEVTLYAKQGRTLGSALSTQDIMVLHRQEERRRQQAKQGVFGFVFKKSKECSLSTDSLGGRSASPARSDETGRSTSPLQPPARPLRKRRPAPKPPVEAQPEGSEENAGDSCKDKVVISHSRNSSDSSGYHEASVLSDNPDSAGRLPETLPRRGRLPLETPRKLAQTSQSSKSLSNLASVPGTLSRGISSTSLSSTGLRKKRAAPLPPGARPLSSAISTQALERIVDSEESLTSDMDPSKPPSDIGAPSKANSDIEERPKASSDIGVTTAGAKINFAKPKSLIVDSKPGKMDIELRVRSGSINVKLPSDEGKTVPVEDAPVDVRVSRKRVGEPVPLPKPRKTSTSSNTSVKPQVLKRKLAPPSPSSRTLTASGVDHLANTPAYSSSDTTGSDASSNVLPETPASSNSVDSSRRSSARSDRTVEKLEVSSTCSTSEEEIFLTPEIDQTQASFDYDSITSGEKDGEENMMTKLPSKNESTAVDKNKQSPLTAKKATGQEKETCAVISTMPKCEHLDELVESKGSSLFKKRRAKVQASIDDTGSENRYGEGAKDSRRPRIPRTASKSNDFETNPLEKQKRHLTSHAEDITFALNLNVVSNVGNLTQQPENDENVGFQGQGEGKSSCGLVAPDANLSETDVLLQKVSDTLSNSLPVSSSNQVPAKRFIAPVEAKSKKANISKETISSSAKKTLNEENSKQQNHDFTDTAIVNTSTPNLTVNSQQDTSDYVSAADEDLSIADWEYQLPAPPSAFRDSNSPVLENYDEVISSPELFRDSEHKEHVESLDNRNQSPILSQQASKNKNGVDKEVRKDVIKQEKHHTQLKSLDPNLKKVIISELETKIGTLPQNSKDFDSKKAMDISSTPKIAPIDNTLSNFTITTYTRQKSLNIFEETEKQFQEKEDERFIKSFATLSRNKNSNDEENNRATKDLGIGTLQRKTKIEDTGDRKLEPKTNTQTLHRWQSDNEKSNIQRSKSYVSVCDKSKFQETVCEDEDDKSNKNAVKMGDSGMKKATSINNISLPKNNEKFSQWRDNILKRQEEPTKEKQLQSLQVLKSILPQLKNAQQAEENVSKESNGAVLPEKTRPETTSNEHSINSNVATACTDKKSEPETKKMPPATNTKRYIYSGPPAINLGSWSERPSHNIHMKRDTDSKLGAHKPNNRTIVNINGSRDERDGSTDCDDSARPLSVLDKSKKIEATTLERREPNELAKKLITHTTATGFKKPVLNKVHLDPKPVVTGVELKKSSPDNKQEESVIDTTPVNFKELSKAFGQDVTLRPKPKRTTLNRRSDLQIGTNFTNSEKVNGSNDEYLTNNNQDTLKSKRFTTVVGLHPQNQAPLKNGISGKDGQPLQFVKGFKLPNGVPKNQNKEPAKEFPRESSVPQPPRPPTMPVITGVTLKSARPKSMPVQIDSRDVLLESIRNFGGRENLKSATERR